MKKLSPCELKDMHEVAEYWAQCLRDRPKAESDKVAAGWLVGVVCNDKDDEWSNGDNADPEYDIVFELAADMEWQDFSPEWQKRNWEAIEHYVQRLQKRYAEPGAQPIITSAQTSYSGKQRKKTGDEDEYDNIHAFYAQEVLPHFGMTLSNDDINWKNVDVVINYYQAAHWFDIGTQQYILFFEDYQRDDKSGAKTYVQRMVTKQGPTYEYIVPTSPTDVSPSYNGFDYMGTGYIPYETGIFTLIKVVNNPDYPIR